MRLPITLLAAGMVTAICAPAPAVCPSGLTPEIFCDDFDCYCQDSPCHQSPPGKCVPGAPKDNAPMRQVWLLTSVNEFDNSGCGSQFNIEDTLLVFSEPFGNGLPNQVSGQLGHTTVTLIDDIKAALGDQYNAVRGTDAHPLVMTFNVNNQTDDKIFAANVFMELSLGADRASTDFVYAPDCSTYCTPPVYLAGRPEILCAQNASVPGCPDPGAAPVRASIAVGFVAKLDTDPCHCAEASHGSKNRHLALYDGKTWWTLDEGVFPGSGNFELTGGLGLDPIVDLNGCTVVLTIKSSTVEIEYRPYLNGVYGPTSTATVPRAYPGAFDTLHAGFGTSCELASATWDNCAAARKCLNGSPGAGRVIFDDFVIHGGEGENQIGACCLPNTDCIETVEANCELLDGRYQGPATTCEGLLCCPYPFADGDYDGDVDQTDFGFFQVCYTGGAGGVPAGCECMDREPDGNVDEDDSAAFARCRSGPNVPWSPALAPSCSP